MRCFLCLICLLFAVAARADETPHWEFNITPYLWYGAVHSSYEKVSPPGARPLAGKTDASILPHLDSFPLMGGAEVRYGRFGLFVDVVALSANLPTQLTTPPFLSGTAQVRDTRSAVVLSYRVVQSTPQYLDLGIGAQMWLIDSNLQFPIGSLGSRTLFADPVIAARYHLALPAKFGLTFIGDIGAFGGAKLTYQVVGTADYTLTQSVVLHAGYRYSYFDFRGSHLHLNAAFNGPLVAATFRF